MARRGPVVRAVCGSNAASGTVRGTTLGLGVNRADKVIRASCSCTVVAHITNCARIRGCVTTRDSIGVGGGLVRDDIIG